MAPAQRVAGDKRPSPRILKTAGKALANPNSNMTTKKLAASVLANGQPKRGGRKRR